MLRILPLALLCGTLSAEIVIDTNLPAGNGKINRREGNTFYFQNEMRDSNGWWFFWNFRVRGAEGKTLKFISTSGEMISTRGPCVSLDKGATWAYTEKNFTPNAFTYTFPKDVKDVWLCMTYPYGEREWNAFLGKYPETNSSLEKGVLCRSRKGRNVELVKVGCLKGTPKYKIFLTCRHHCAETTASFVLEGILSEILSDSETGKWFQDQVQVVALPFVDKDGVFDGDQGKNRRPHDHCRDYNEDRPQVYPEISTIMKKLPEWSKGKPDIVMDIHSPWIRGLYNEFVYQVGIPHKGFAVQQQRIGTLLEQVHKGGTHYRQKNDLPFGRAWNTGKNYGQGNTLVLWAKDRFPQAKLVTSWEIPFASANDGVTLTPDNLRHLGRDMAKVFRLFLTDPNAGASAKVSSPVRK